MSPIGTNSKCSLTLLLHFRPKKKGRRSNAYRHFAHAHRCELGVCILCQHHLTKNIWPHQVERTGNKKDYFTDSKTNGWSVWLTSTGELMGESDRSLKTRARRQQKEWGKQNSVHILPPTNKGRQLQIRRLVQCWNALLQGIGTHGPSRQRKQCRQRHLRGWSQGRLWERKTAEAQQWWWR